MDNDSQTDKQTASEAKNCSKTIKKSNDDRMRIFVNLIIDKILEDNAKGCLKKNQTTDETP